MTKEFAAAVKGWSEKAQRNMRLIVMEASEGVYNAMTERQPSVKETGGSFQVGKVPVDQGYLIGSVQITVGGGTTGTGSPGQAPDYIGSITGFQIGEPITAAFTADYARHVEYGTARMPGRFFVRNAVAQWPAFVAAAAARYRD